MQISKRVRKADSSQPVTTTLKIQPKFRFNRRSETIAPEIKLCGNWLYDPGFCYWERVVVATSMGMLVITLERVEGAENDRDGQ